MATTYLCSDYHLGHESIARFRPFESEQEHYDHLKEKWHKIVTKRDTVICLGDMCFTEERLKDFMGWTACQKILIAGNHDLDRISMRTIAAAYDKVFSLYRYKGMWLTHAPIHPDELRGKPNVHGHCVPYHYEILTEDGWKNFNSFTADDVVYSRNPSTGMIESHKVNYIVDNPCYTGGVYRYKKRSFEIDCTDRHTMVHRSDGGQFSTETAEEFFGKSSRSMYVSGVASGRTGSGLSKDELMLYIAIAADASITPANLCRFILKREYKIKWVLEVIERLGYAYRTGVISSGENAGNTWIHFRAPTCFDDWNFKGLDKKLLNCTAPEIEFILEAYQITDGIKNSERVTIIYTGKKCEYDLLQQLFVTSGYAAKGYTRYHGFGENLQYQLSVTKTETRMVSKLRQTAKKIDVVDEGYWCVNVNHHNFFVRAPDGSVHLTGNCHNHVIDDPRYLNICAEQTEYYPVNIEIVRKVLVDRGVLPALK